jgi:hypothetical protein
MARIQWQRFVWRSGADEYAFDVVDGGLFGKLTAAGREVTLPMAAWEGLLDSVAAARKGKVKSERMQPDRAFARWSDVEIARLEADFSRGQTIADLARQHNRSLDAVEHQLVKLGLWNRLERRPMSGDPPFPDTSVGDAAAPPWDVNEGGEDPSGGLRQGA